MSRREWTNWDKVAQVLGGEVIRSFGMAQGVRIEETRCVVEVTAAGYSLDPFKAERTENGARWSLTGGNTPEEAVENLGPEPEPQTVESFLDFEKPSQRFGPTPDCPECGARLEFTDDRGRWVRSWALVCPECEFEERRGDNSRFLNWKASRQPAPSSENEHGSPFGDPR